MIIKFVKRLYLVFAVCVIPVSAMEPVEYQVGDVRLVLCAGDITKQRVDAIVNAANNHMLGGAGVDGAIHRAAGPGLRAYNEQNIPLQGSDRCPVGQVRVTPSFNLAKAGTGIRFIIHTNGPRGTSENRAQLLEQCYRNAVEAINNPVLLKKAVADDKSPVRSIAFPSISIGIFGYPQPEATDVAVRTVIDAIRQQKSLQEVRFVLFNPECQKLNELFNLYRATCDHYLLGCPKPVVVHAQIQRDDEQQIRSSTPVKQPGLINRFARYLGILAWQCVLRPASRPFVWSFRYIASRAQFIWFKK